MWGTRSHPQLWILILLDEVSTMTSRHFEVVTSIKLLLLSTCYYMLVLRSSRSFKWSLITTPSCLGQGPQEYGGQRLWDGDLPCFAERRGRTLVLLGRSAWRLHFATPIWSSSKTLAKLPEGLSISRTNLCIDTKAERVESKAIARECAGTFEGQGIFAALQLEDLNIANRP